ncbi:hypothetical protein [Burkholderia sp. Ac-20365]|jgi:hypothetical protein|nr:hypothetical protein [Burkholderia sp. Ac-20365]MBN3762886.1 hypothetical protein [Burkholderia sp. Ac-20365]
MQAMTRRNGQQFKGNGWQRPRAAGAGNTQGKEVMQHMLDIAGSAAR